jgi:hypothetical protein
MNYNGYTNGEGYNLKDIDVLYNENKGEIVCIMSNYGTLLMVVNIKEVRGFDGDAPTTLNLNEWKEYLLSSKENVEFMHVSMVEAILTRKMLLENELYNKRSKLIEQTVQLIMERG